MSERLSHWIHRISFPETAKAGLGFGYEYWNLDPRLYEGWQQLHNQQKSLGHPSHSRAVAYNLASHLLMDVVVAAGEVENSITDLRHAVTNLQTYAQIHKIQEIDDVEQTLGHLAAITAWYAFADLLTWSRCVVERMDRRAGDSKNFPRQGLLPAIKPKRLQTKVDILLRNLQSGPAGQARLLANFVLHSAMVQHPQSGVRISNSGSVILPIPDAPDKPVSHWYLLDWTARRDGIVLAEGIWLAIQEFVDQLLNSFEASVPRRLRKEHSELPT